MNHYFYIKKPCNFLMQGQVTLGPENYESTYQITYIYEKKSCVQEKPKSVQLYISPIEKKLCDIHHAHKPFRNQWQLFLFILFFRGYKVIP